MFVIKSKKTNNYFQKKWFNSFYHFVTDITDARKMQYSTAMKIMNGFKSKENYELIEVKGDSRRSQKRTQKI